MSILAIDVGKTTGYARLNDTGEVVMTGTVHADDLETSLLATWATEDNQVCIEYPIFNVASTTAILRHATDTIRLLYPDAFTVRPGVWKGTAIALGPLPDEVRDVKLSQHEKDAINIARWYRGYLKVYGDVQ